MTERAHARRAPSSASRWGKCPGSLGLIEQVEAARGRDPAGPAAREGTVAMAFVESAMRQNTLNEALVDLVTREDMPDGIPVDPTEVTQEMRKIGWEARNYFLDLATKAGAGRWAVEDPVTVPRGRTDGHPDFWALLPDRLVVADFKFGAGVPVHARENGQMTHYSSGIADRLELPEDLPVEFIVYQPRCIETGVHKWVTTVGAVHAAVEETAAFVDANPDLIVSGEHCKFCPAVLSCPARLAEAEEIAATEDPGPDADAAEDAYLKRLLEIGDRVTNLVRKAKDRAVAKLMGGNFQGQGWTLKNGRGTNVWKGGAEAAALLDIAAGKLGADAMSKPALLTPAQVRDNVPDGDLFFKRWSLKTPGNPTLTPGETAARQVNWPKGAA